MLLIRYVPKIKLTLIDLNEIFPINHDNLIFPFQSKVMIKKTAKNGQNCYVAEKNIVSKLTKISTN